MNNVFSFFDQIYCINLPEHANRWNGAMEEFKKVGIESRVHQIYVDSPHSTIMPPNITPAGYYGLTLSQLKIFGHALSVNAKNILIFEDDVCLKLDRLNELTNAIASLPNNWDLFFLGGIPHITLKTSSNNLAALTGGFEGAYAMAINGKTLLGYHDFYLNCMARMNPAHADRVTKAFMPQSNSYAMVPPFCGVRNILSTIDANKPKVAEKIENYWRINLK